MSAYFWKNSFAKNVLAKNNTFTQWCESCAINGNVNFTDYVSGSFNIFNIVLFLFSILVLSGIDQKSGNRKHSVWVLPNIWRLRWVRDTKSGTDVSKEVLLNPENRQEYSFYRFWVIKGKPTRGGVKLAPSSLILELTMRIWFRHEGDVYHYLCEMERNNAS